MTLQKILEAARKHIVLIVIVAVLGASGLIFWSWTNGVNNVAKGKQQDLITLDNNIAITLSNCLDTSNQSAKIVFQQYKVLKDTFVATAQARYENNSSANEAIRGGAMFSGIRESYPQIDQKTWDTLLATVADCRGEVAESQMTLQFWAGDFVKWCQTGGIFEKAIRNNYPNDLLYTKGPDGKELRGMAALEHLRTPITIGDAKTAMQNREMPEQDLFGTPTPVPVPSATPTR